MQTIITLIIISGIIFIAVHHGILLARYGALKKNNSENDMPIRLIFVMAQGSNVLDPYVKLNLESHLKHDIEIVKTESCMQEGWIRTTFESGDETIVYVYPKAKIDVLSELDKISYVNKIFFDYSLPIGAERDVIEKLGLKNYMVKIGICGGETNGI